MKKISYTNYGAPDVLKLTEVQIPEPKANEVLVKVEAAGVNPIDFKIRRGDMKMIAPGKFPRTPGGDMAGSVIKNGDATNKFKPGDKVFAMLTMAGGGYAEYLCVKEDLLSLKPNNLSFTEAASIPLAGLTAYQSLTKRGKPKKGSKILINGASGGVGMFALQMAKHFGAEVTGVCSARNMEFVKENGADSVVDYTQQDFTKSDKKYDIVFDAVATRSPAECASILKKGGIYVTTIPSPAIMFRQMLNPLFPKKVYGILCKPGYKDLDKLAEWATKGIIRPSVEKVFPIQESNKAHEYIETGRVRGKIVVLLPHEEDSK